MWDVKVVQLGQVRYTPAVLEAIERLEHVPVLSVMAACLARHMFGDWGDVPPEDKAANDLALVTGDRLMSAYTLIDGTTVWVITEADRSATTLLLPQDY